MPRTASSVSMAQRPWRGWAVKMAPLSVSSEAANPRWRPLDGRFDVTRWVLVDGDEVEILNILDDHSRLVVASQVSATTRAADVVARHPKPA
jgi:hypothetical protein